MLFFYSVCKQHYHIVGAQHVPAFGMALKNGAKVHYELAAPHIVALAIDALKHYPKSGAFLLECTEMPMFSNAIRQATDLPVFDAITNSDYLMASTLPSRRFGAQT